MYLITNSEHKIVDISNISRYVRRQPNGIVVLCDRADAEAIYSDDHNKYYPIDRVGYVADSHQLISVENVPENIVVQNENITESFRILNILTQFVKKTVEKLYFLPKVNKTDKFFNISYEMFAINEFLQESLDEVYSLDFKEISDVKNIADILIENYLNYVIFQFLKFKSYKFKDIYGYDIFNVKSDELKRNTIFFPYEVAKNTLMKMMHGNI